ncbi:MAG: arsenate reductase ArsC [Bryobacteraceae bacterium]
MARYKVLFLCIGNSCRSQMAEGFARTYGADVMDVQSAGLGPAMSVSPTTVATMMEKNIDMSEAVPRGVDAVDRNGLSLIVNISGQKLPVRSVPLVDWDVRDPIGRDEKVFREVRDEIERRVMELILRLRAEQREEAKPPADAANPRER